MDDNNIDGLLCLKGRVSALRDALTFGFGNIRDTAAAADFSPPPRETNG